jgi:alkanesulfonate monooxygenase SsuD/methylene tetrahydromethanopterin reductase-like flavin-dependent oxidoreductase (luciferase family)
MRWGIHTIEDDNAQTHDPLPRFYANLVERARELGDESFWLTEPHSGLDARTRHRPRGGHRDPSLNLTMGAIPLVRRRARQPAGGVVSGGGPHLTATGRYGRHAAAVVASAESGGGLRLLDNLRDGRLDLGSVAASSRSSTSLGVATAESRPCFNESLAVIRRAWTEPS